VCSIRAYDAVIRLQGGIEVEKEEREKWINKDMKKMVDSVKGAQCRFNKIMCHTTLYYKTPPLCLVLSDTPLI